MATWTRHRDGMAAGGSDRLFATPPCAWAAAPAAGAAASVEFSMANVDAVLDDVRPYLIQDGGEVTVLEADPATKNVVLRLEGACGSCPSSTTTAATAARSIVRSS